MKLYLLILVGRANIVFLVGVLPQHWIGTIEIMVLSAVSTLAKTKTHPPKSDIKKLWIIYWRCSLSVISVTKLSRQKYPLFKSLWPKWQKVVPFQKVTKILLNFELLLPKNNCHVALKVAQIVRNRPIWSHCLEYSILCRNSAVFIKFHGIRRFNIHIILVRRPWRHRKDESDQEMEPKIKRKFINNWQVGRDDAF